MSRFTLAVAAVLSVVVLLVSQRTPDTARAAAMTYTVNTTADTLDNVCDPTNCSLRDALFQSNSTGDQDTINFNIPGGGVKTITLGSNLPDITNHVFIDGRTQPGTSCITHSLMISLAGGGATQGLKINYTTGNGTGITGLNIRDINGPAIVIAGDNGHVVRCSNIGTNASGTAASPNTGDGVVITSGTAGNGGITIGAIVGAGDPDDQERNIISGNLGAGVRSSAGTPVRVSGNYIGTNAAGTAAIGNGDSGVIGVSGTNFEVGLSATNIGAGNLISGNTGAGDAGIKLVATPNAQVHGNMIGLNAAGTAAIPNQVGVLIAATNIFVGDSTVQGRNVISGNLNAGVVFQAGSQGNLLANYIGTNAAGTAAVPNVVGVVVQSLDVGIGSSAGHNIISGNSGAGIAVNRSAGNVNVTNNYIGYQPDGITTLPNGGDGVSVKSDTHAIESVAVMNNRIFARRSIISDPLRNGVKAEQTSAVLTVRSVFVEDNSIDSDGHAIDLFNTGDAANAVTPNDDKDLDTDGPNFFQNFPVITSADANTQEIGGTLNTTPGVSAFVQFYKSNRCDSATSRISQTYLGFWGAFTDGTTGDATFLKNATFVEPFATGDWITANVRTLVSGGHSEFSACFQATGAAAQTITQLQPDSAVAGSGDFLLTVLGANFTNATEIRWNGTGHATTFQGAGQVQALIPAASLGSAKSTAQVTVFDGAVTSNSLPFAVRRSSSDANCNGTATGADALLVLKVIAGTATNNSGCSSDALGNGGAGIDDVLWIRREVAGLVEPLVSTNP